MYLVCMCMSAYTHTTLHKVSLLLLLLEKAVIIFKISNHLREISVVVSLIKIIPNFEKLNHSYFVHVNKTYMRANFLELC